MFQVVVDLSPTDNVIRARFLAHITEQVNWIILRKHAELIALSTWRSHSETNIVNGFYEKLFLISLIKVKTVSGLVSVS